MKGISQLLSSKQPIRISLFAFALILLSKTFYTWNTTVHLYVAIFLFLLYLIYSYKFVKLNFCKILNLVFVFILIHWYALINNANIYGIILLYIILLIVLISSQERAWIFDKVASIYALILGISLFFYILLIFFSISIPSEDIAPLNSAKDYNYRAFPFLVIPNLLNAVRFRFHGPFDEPGVIGSFSAIFLIADYYNLKKKRNIVILLGGIFSFSLFFYVMTFFFFFYNRIRYILMFLILILIFIVIFRDNEIVKNLVFERLTISQEKGLEGNNRDTDTFKKAYKEYIGTYDYLFGVGPNPSNDPSVGSASYKRFIFYYGVVFFFLTCSFFIINAIQKLSLCNKQALYCYFLILAGMTFQRPFFYDIFYFFLLFASIDQLSKFNPVRRTEMSVNISAN